MDINELRRLWMAGESMGDMVRGLVPRGPFGSIEDEPPQNALAQVLAQADGYAGNPDGPPIYEQRRAQPAEATQQQPIPLERVPGYDPETMRREQLPMNSMRNNETGKMTYFAPQGAAGFSDRPYTQEQGAYSGRLPNGLPMPTTLPQGAPEPQGGEGAQVQAGGLSGAQIASQERNAEFSARKPLMRVYGAGSGGITELSPEAQGNVALDYSRAQIDIPGLGRGVYTKDGRSAIGADADGKPFRVILGYDAKASDARNERALKRQLTEQQIQQTQASTQHTLEQVRASRVNNPSMDANGRPSGQAAVTGPAVLQSLSQPIADQVKALAEGRMQFPGGFALKSPYWANMISLVSKYDPSFDAVNYNTRAATRKDFTSGKSAENITALNTAIAHLGSLSDAYGKLGNSDFPAWNAVANATGKQMNPETQGNLARVATTAEAVAHELAKVFRSSGMSEAEIRAWKDQINPNAPPAATKAIIQGAIELMNGRLEALSARYGQGMGTMKDPLEMLTLEARHTWERLAGGSHGAAHSGQGRQGQSNGDGSAGARRMELDAPPSAAKYKGKQMTAPDGTRYVSDGSRWLRKQ
jgi:hypothetical protein